MLPDAQGWLREEQFNSSRAVLYGLDTIREVVGHTIAHLNQNVGDDQVWAELYQFFEMLAENAAIVRRHADRMRILKNTAARLNMEERNAG